MIMKYAIQSELALAAYATNLFPGITQTIYIQSLREAGLAESQPKGSESFDFLSI